MLELKEKIRLNLIDTIVLSVYYIFICFSFLALFGLFKPSLVYLVLVVLLLVLFYLRKHISFSKKYLWFFLLVPPAITGFGFLLGFFSGDAYWLWLPFARNIVISHQVPDFLFGYYVSQMPLLHLLFAGTFAVFHSFNEFLCLWVPLFFTAATLIVLCQWAKDKGLDKKILFFLPFLFLTNFTVAAYGGWNLLQESILLFFATAFFYYYEKYSENQQRKDLAFLAISFILVIASKIIGLFLILLLFQLFFKEKDKKRFLSWFFLFSVPILFWFFRNYLIYGNPIFPMLNSLFGGAYSFALQKSFFPGYIATDKNVFAIFIKIAKDFWLAFPFVFLSFYGFFKKRRYEYIILFLLFFFAKEIFYFTATNSAIRYYYLFLGLFLLYGLLGLEQIKSKWFMSGLILLAIAGLLFIPAINSTSSFISLFESKFSLFGQFFNYLHNYWYLFLIVLIPFIYLASQKQDVDIFLIFLYSLYILHLQFVYNKSWFNTWSFIFLSILFLIFFALKNKIKYLKQIIVIFIVLVVFSNSWAMASIYYWRRGEIVLPVPHVWGVAPWAREVLDRETDSDQCDDFYILIATSPDYFNWQTDYQAIHLFDFGFRAILDSYDDNLSDSALWHLFIEKKIKYIVKNKTTKYKFNSSDGEEKEFKQFFNKIENSDHFKLIDSYENKYFVWRVY